ncbi:uncharacterized protein PITG_23325 [Phytophthora infestans T30-4]|uniref:Uncharacterized protein n=1 Tax=Phytophthora infestans (strain T30-4) TaxID=403677 RepID=D0NJ95_PHYIT|nr:uncharacterized protein PITG_23325 [Phytophthora infestans T30-4]EEY59613.1 predicted protein [Phytophthora infestans T30-4]|eukprot:XP_002900806.1 predicted protein [Phytophthora infestans T30-4]
MVTQGLKPARICNGMARRFRLSKTEMPTLRQAQWFVDQLAYGSTVSDTNPFSFGWKRDAAKPDVGNGSDETPFLVGLRAKHLLLNSARDPESLVSHMDVTFKLNQVVYLVIVCGISDMCRSFHLVALFITSQRLEDTSQC